MIHIKMRKKIEKNIDLYMYIYIFDIIHLLNIHILWAERINFLFKVTSSSWKHSKVKVHSKFPPFAKEYIYKYISGVCLLTIGTAVCRMIELKCFFWSEKVSSDFGIVICDTMTQDEAEKVDNAKASKGTGEKRPKQQKGRVMKVAFISHWLSVQKPLSRLSIPLCW